MALDVLCIPVMLSWYNNLYLVISQQHYHTAFITLLYSKFNFTSPKSTCIHLIVTSSTITFFKKELGILGLFCKSTTICFISSYVGFEDTISENGCWYFWTGPAKYNISHEKKHNIIYYDLQIKWGLIRDYQCLWLVNECTYCTEPLPQVWLENKNSEKNRRKYYNNYKYDYYKYVCVKTLTYIPVLAVKQDYTRIKIGQSRL